MITYIQTNSLHDDFRNLVEKLDRELKIRDGEKDNAFYSQFNQLDKINHVIVAYVDNVAVGCGAIKEYSATTMEIKRMYVEDTMRGKGIASGILKELEKWATSLHYTTCVLETGIRQPEAIHLYKKSGYQIIPNYGQYQGIETSICFEKSILNK